MIFQAAFFNFQPQVWHGGGLARAAHWIYIYIYLYSKGPESAEHTFNTSVPEDNGKKHSESFRVQSGIYNKISKTIRQKWAKNIENRGLEGVWELLEATWDDKSLQSCLGRFWPGSDRPKSRPNGPRWRQVKAKMAPRWSKLGPRWPS